MAGPVGPKTNGCLKGLSQAGFPYDRSSVSARMALTTWGQVDDPGSINTKWPACPGGRRGQDLDG